MLKALYPTVDVRNDFLRRAAVLHTDIALLLPEQAAEFTLKDVTVVADPSTTRLHPPRERDQVVFSNDSEYLASAEDSAHWWMASELLRGILPDAGSDPFVALYHRAVIAHFESMRLFGSATHAVNRARRVVPGDPVVLFYEGALHEANASPLLQSVEVTRPKTAGGWRFPSPESEWHRAEACYRKAIEAGAPPDAAIHLGRVLGHLGKHSDAAAVLKEAAARVTEPRLRYLAHLFLGVELGAMGDLNGARSALDIARRLFPTAQSPVVALADASWRAGSRLEAMAALTSFEQLPSDADARDDPYWAYYESFASDADHQLEAVRRWLDARGGASR